jgi:Protein of unknown function (DUF3995)
MLATALIAVLVTLAALHVYWAAGGRAGAQVAVPRVAQTGDAARPLFAPSPWGTLAVALALLAAATFVTAAIGGFGSGRPVRVGRVITGILALAFLLRGVGDFRYVGLFKSIGEEPFRSWDTWLFSPLCVAVAVAAFAVARGRTPTTTHS